jgi:small subunit ribosomal protein S7
MARRGFKKTNKILPDPVYGDLMVTKLIGRAMKDGKKTVIETQVYKAFEIIKEKTGEEAMAVFHRALDNIRPTTEVRPRRIGGAAYQVPMTVRGPRRDSLGIRWLVNASRQKSNSEFHSYAEKLAAEIMDAAKGEGLAVKKKQDVEKMAEANRAFAHFKW